MSGGGEGLLVALGIKLHTAIAGLAGGVVNMLYLRKADIWTLSGALIGGAFTGYFLGEPLAKAVGLSDYSDAAVFVVGFAGMPLVAILADRLRSRVGNGKEQPK